ncbi:MAG: GAF domain-containing protein [Thermodesulfobacteriota bacterium]|nr:GAF domain-containing protein [Thermodesulfobacteriota bacterium]
MERRLEQFLGNSPLLQKLNLSPSERAELIRLVDEDYFQECFSEVILEVEKIVNIDPALPLEKILEQAAGIIVKAMGAEAVSIRLLDPTSLRMLSLGSSGLDNYKRPSSIPTRDTIAGKVIREDRSITVSSICDDPNYKDKKIIERKGYHSLLAVPLHIPKFSATSSDTFGSMQIYYREDNRKFNNVEIIYAELLSRRISFVLTNKKILDLQELNLRKKKISDKIFVKLSNREGIKIKDFFILIIPELDKFLQVRSCTLFSVSSDCHHIRVEVPYPLELTYHEIGYTFTVSHHPYFNVAIHGGIEHGDSAFERIDPSYLLIKDPLHSSLITSGMRNFVKENQIHSILLVPLRVDNKVRHLLTFYAADQKRFFTDEEIELLIFFGKEIVKASKLEFLSDMLHDLKNPIVAVAGLANRAKKLLETCEPGNIKEKLTTYLNIISSETVRVQDLVLTMSGEGNEHLVDLCHIAMQRFDLNEAVIRESRRPDITSSVNTSEEPLPVHCPILGLERIIDNLFNNATKAIPPEGGKLTMRCFRDGAMACLRIENSGEIPADQIDQVKSGEVKGRGLNIIQRFILTQHGKIDIHTEKGQTIFTVGLPLHEPDN